MMTRFLIACGFILLAYLILAGVLFAGDKLFNVCGGVDDGIPDSLLFKDSLIQPSWRGFYLFS